MTLRKSIRGMGRENGCVQAMHECMFVRFRPYSLVIVHTWLLVHTTYLLRPHWPWTASLPYYRVIRGWVLFFGILGSTNKKSSNASSFLQYLLNFGPSQAVEEFKFIKKIKTFVDTELGGLFFVVNVLLYFKIVYLESLEKLSSWESFLMRIFPLEAIENLSS